MLVWISHEQGRAHLGELPPGVVIAVVERPTGADVAAAGVRLWVPPFLGAPPPSRQLAGGALAVVQLLTAGVDAWVGRLPAGVTLCSARGVLSATTAEWAVTAILAHVRDFPAFALAQSRREWDYHRTGELCGKRVLIVGAGSVGTAIAARLAPFEVDLTLVGRTPRDGMHGVDELPVLLPEADVVVLAVPLTPATRGMVGAEFLAAMPDGALLVNAARGPVVDTGALTAEVGAGRLGAALDVTDPEPLPADHPLWSMPNLLLTPHVAGSVPGVLARGYTLVGDQIRRYAAGEPLRNVVAGDY